MTDQPSTVIFEKIKLAGDVQCDSWQRFLVIALPTAQEGLNQGNVRLPSCLRLVSAYLHKPDAGLFEFSSCDGQYFTNPVIQQTLGRN